MSEEARILWVKDDEGVLSRFYTKVTKSWKPKDSDETMKVTHEEVTITVPQNLDEVPEHSVLTALELVQWAVAYKKYLRYRELIPTGLESEKISDRVNAERIGQVSEVSTINQLAKRVKSAKLTAEQMDELNKKIDELLNS